MTDEDEKMKKMRLRMERDAYSVLLSFKDGATPQQLVKRMDDTLGYSYTNEFHKGGMRSMDHLLREHKQVRQTGDGKFKIIPTEEVSDLVALIAKQKDGGKKKKGGAKGRRPATSAGHRNGYHGGVAMRTSPKGISAFRPSSRTTFTKPYYPNQQPFHRPTTAASSYHPPQGGFGGIRQPFNQNFQRPLCAPSATFVPPTIQRPLSKPAQPAPSMSTSFTNPSSSSKRVPAQSPAPSVDRGSQHSETVKPATKTCQMPSIKEFSDNSKKMMLKMHPKTVHLSELTELYSQEYNVTVDPLQVFSKSWKMLVMTTFKDWLEMSGSEVGLKPDWFKKYGGTMPAKPAQPMAPYTVTAVPVTKPAQSAQQQSPNLPPVPPAKSPFATSSLPALQGFRYQVPSALKSPTDLVTQKMKGLTVSSRQALPTPEKPPGIVRGNKPTFTSMKPDFKQNPYSKTSRPQSTMFAAPKKSAFSGLRPFTASAVRHQASLKSISDGSNSTSETSPSSSLEIHSQPPSASPPLAPPVRMRSTQSTAPSHRLIGRALADVKKQDDEAPVPRRVETVAKSLYVSTTPTPTQNTKQPKLEYTAKTTVTAEDVDEWDDRDMATSSQTTHAPSMAGRRPSRLPPMSKGSKSTASSHHSHKSACSSRTASPGRHLEHAVSCSLPDNDDW